MGFHPSSLGKMAKQARMVRMLRMAVMVKTGAVAVLGMSEVQEGEGTLLCLELREELASMEFLGETVKTELIGFHRLRILMELMEVPSIHCLL